MVEREWEEFSEGMSDIRKHRMGAWHAMKRLAPISLVRQGQLIRNEFQDFKPFERQCANITSPYLIDILGLVGTLDSADGRILLLSL